MIALQHISSGSGSTEHLPVLALHSLGLDGQSWAALGSAIPSHDLYALDQKGHGQSRADIPTGFADLVADAASALASLPYPKVHLVGHSMGGAVAATLAGEVAEKLASLSLIATPFAGVDAFTERATAVADGTLDGVASQTLERWFGPDANGPEVDHARSSLMAMQLDGFDASWRALAQFPGYDSFDAPFPSTLICSFSEDRSTPPAVGEQIASSLQEKALQVKHQIIDGAGHMGVLTHAKTVARHLEQHWHKSEANLVENAHA